MRSCCHCRRPRRTQPCYHDFWWVYDSVAGVYCGLGINGQMLMIHHPSNTVIVKFSTWPDRMDYVFADLTDTAACWPCAARSSTAISASDGRSCSCCNEKPAILR